MKIVIDIPDNIMEYLRNNGCLSVIYTDEVAKAIINGTPLPKGHGKIIAEPTEEDITKTVGGQNDFAECIKDAVKAVFDNALTIIEADKEAEND